MVVLKRRLAARLELEDVIVTMRPAGEAEFELATASAGRHIAAITSGRESLSRYGVFETPEVIATADDVRAALAIGETMVAIELGVRHITSWEGVTLDDETPAAVEPSTIALLFNARAPSGSSYGRLFLEKARAESILEPAAKNA